MLPRLANHRSRATLLFDDGSLDVERSSDGRFSSDPMRVLAEWESFREWAAPGRAEDAPIDESALGPCVPAPSQVFAIGLNYRDHAAEAGLELPKTPMVFTKFPSCLVGPRADVILFSDRVDWEVELVAVIGRRAVGVSESEALGHVAGYCVGQDISDRGLQFSDRPPQFSLGKSRESFGPIGPALVSSETVGDPNQLAMSCDVAGERMQDGSTADMIFSVAELVSYLSRHCPLEAGDLIFTGTPAGVGSVRDPRRYLAEGEEIVSEIERLGVLRNRCVAAPS